MSTKITTTNQIGTSCRTRVKIFLKSNTTYLQKLIILRYHKYFCNDENLCNFLKIINFVIPDGNVFN